MSGLQRFTAFTAGRTRTLWVGGKAALTVVWSRTSMGFGNSQGSWRTRFRAGLILH